MWLTDCNYCIVITNSNVFCIRVRTDYYEYLFSLYMGKWQISILVDYLNCCISKIHASVQEYFMVLKISELLEEDVEVVKNVMTWDLIF